MSHLNNQSIHSDNSVSSLNQSFQTSKQIQFPINITQNLSFNNSNTDYVITIEATEERLTLLVEDRFDINMWRGDFTSKYLEEITRKTGKERSYQTFVQMMVGTVQGQYSQLYIDIMAYQDLQLLKSGKLGEQPSQAVKNSKKYLILTHLIAGTTNKVHYPLPLNQVETGAYTMDRETMLRMVKRMSQTLSDFKQMSSTQQNPGPNTFTQQSFYPRQTAKEFFSKENIMHPVVEENQQLKVKLQQLEQAKQLGGAVSLNSLHFEKNKLDQDFQSYQNLTGKEIKRLKGIKQQLQKLIEDTKCEIQSERPQSAYSNLSTSNQLPQNQTVTSGFGAANSMANTEVEELRRQLAEVSVELEDTKEQYRKRLALQQKDLEEQYESLQSYRQDEKTMRVKVNQLENELDHQLRRLDIICKSKGVQRPVLRKVSSTRQASSYVSPYRQGPGSQGTSPSLKRPVQNNSSAKRPSPIRNLQYTPPGKKGYSPSYSNGSTKFRQSPLNTGYSNQSAKNKGQQSPGARSNASNGSQASGNRLYSPSGRVRNNSGSTQMYGSNATGTVNRVRREPAVGTANSRSTSRNRVQTPTSQKEQPRTNSQTRNTAYNKQGKPSYGQTSILQKQGQKSMQQPEKRNTLFNNQTNTQKQSMILDQQKSGGTIDEKIEKLQSLLKMAKKV